jgi:hypothetical protein
MQMSIELLLLICTLSIVLLGGFVSYTDQAGKRRRIAIIISIVFGVISAFLGIEEITRREKIVEVTETLNREWLLFQDAYVESIEFEIFIPDGFFPINNFIAASHKIRFSIDGFALNTEWGGKSSETFVFSDIFTPEHLSQSGRLGVARSTIRVSDDGKSIEKFEAIHCFASNFTTNLFLSDWNKDELTGTQCSASVNIPIPNNTLRLKDLSKSPSISLVLPKTILIECAGICKNIFISVRINLGNQGGMFDRMIELSPQVYLKQPSSNDDTSVTYELSGSGVLKLAESHFKHSFGFRNRENFPVTMGFLHWIYHKVTLETKKVTFIDIVWTTDPSPDYEALQSALDPANRKSATPLGTDEWCGFGDSPVCWYRFVLVKLEPDLNN